MIDAGYGHAKLWDDNNPEFAVCEVLAKQTITADGDPDAFISLDFDEVK
jgi:hypothetical protein